MWGTLSRACCCLHPDRIIRPSQFNHIRQTGKEFGFFCYLVSTHLTLDPKNPMKILPTSGPHLLTSIVLPTEPNSSSSGVPSGTSRTALTPGLGNSYMWLPIGLATSTVPRSRVYRCSISGNAPQHRENWYRHLPHRQQIPLEWVLTIYWRWFKCPLTEGTRHARDWVDQRHLVRNLWESREPKNPIR